MQHPLVIAAIVILLAALVAVLAEPRSPRDLATVFLVAVVCFVTLMGLGAVFGKTLGDFLRNAN